MWESSLILGISCAWRRELNPRAYQHSQGVNQDLTEPAGNRITCFGTPLLVWNSGKKRWSQSLQRYGRATSDRAFSITPLLFDLRIELLPQRERLVDIIPSDQKLTVDPATLGLSAAGESTKVT